MSKEHRMYCVVLRHLSGIQKGIQSAHAIVEYSNTHKEDKNYIQWATIDKTLILLEVNSTNELTKLYVDLIKITHKVCSFYEPDINNSITAIAFLLDDRVWNPEEHFTSTIQTRRLRELTSLLRLASN